MQELDRTHHDVVVIGGGQAGLSMSHCLTRREIPHVVLERDTVAHEWTDRRWDSFCLVTPNWQCRLPGYPYPGDDPDGFMVRAQILEYLRGYRASFDPPVYEHTCVSRLHKRRNGAFELVTDRGTLTADQVVMATGPYQVPRTPRLSERLPATITQLHSAQYRNPEQLPAGAVLVVGTGQSGCQIAEDLHLAGRDVHLATGSAPRVARCYRGRDVVAWLDEIGYYRRSIDEFADADAVRFRVNHYVTGRDGGRDIDLRAFARDGMSLYGRLVGVDPDGGSLHFADDLAENLDHADRVSESIKDSIDAYIGAHGIEVPAERRYHAVWTPPEGPDPGLDLAAAGVGTVIWCTGFGRDDRWVELPMFDGRGHPAQHRGVSPVEGLYLLGLPWQHTWGSGRFSGVAADAEYLLERIVNRRGGAYELDVRWLAGTATSTHPIEDDRTAPRTVA